jgi:molecular chaperone Hsp33
MAVPPADRFGDHVLPFQIEALGIRGRLVRIGGAAEAIVCAHDYPPPVAMLLTETLVMAAALASGLKYDGIFTVQLQGTGPVGLVIVDVTSNGDMRGYARFSAERIAAVKAVPARGCGMAPIPHLLGGGTMIFTVDQGPNTERYQGVTLLEGKTLSECCHAYFRQSEQLATAIVMCSADPAGLLKAHPRAAALMLQRLPQDIRLPAVSKDEDDNWRRAVSLMSGVTLDELLADDISDEDLLYDLFHQEGVRVWRRRILRHRCRCSQRKVERTIQAFPEQEMRAMLIEGVLTVTCEFCKTTYALNEQALERLYA